MPDESLTAGLKAGDRRSLARAITLIESSRPEDRVAAAALLSEVKSLSGRALRVGVSGAPGAGKSTFIEALGMLLVGLRHRVAVLAVDPSSTVHGGSILGDKTRMERLATQDAAFIRPTPSAGSLGGVADRTRDALLLCEAAGYGIVIVETVGIGQSEVAVAELTDLMVLLQVPNLGDDLQAIKRGVMEFADIVVINKSDLDREGASRAALQWRAGMRQPDCVYCVSSITGDGLVGLWTAIEAHVERRRQTGLHDRRRQKQMQSSTRAVLQETLVAEMNSDPQLAPILARLASEVEAGALSPRDAARQLLASIREAAGPIPVK
jgi:LAO/AO transport system kinase